MKIALEVSGMIGAPGYKTYVSGLLDGFERIGFKDFILVSSCWRRLDVYKGFLNGFPTASLRMPQMFYIPAEVYGFRPLNRFYESLGVNLVHGLCSYVPALKHIPTVLTLHYAGPWSWKTWWQRMYYERAVERSVKEAAQIIVPSTFSKKMAEAYLSASRGKVNVIYHGVDILPALPQIQPGAYFLYVGPVSEHKNVFMLLDAMKIVVAKRNEISLLILGYCGLDYANEFLNARKKMKLESSVSCIGPVDHEDMPAWYQRAIAVLCPSMTEGFSFPAVEAMAQGVPVIAINAGALPEVVGEGGRMVNDAEGMAAAMLDLFDNLEAGKIASKLAFEKSQEYDWKTTAEQTLEVYSKVPRLPS